MSQSIELNIQILDLYQVDKLRLGAIARQLSIHHSVVRRVLAQARVRPLEPPARPSKTGVFLPLIRQTLEMFPTLPASRVYKIVVDLGYNGGPDHFRHLVACMRPRFDAAEWMLALLQKRIGIDAVRQQTAHLPELDVLLDRLYNGKLSERSKAPQ